MRLISVWLLTSKLAVFAMMLGCSVDDEELDLSQRLSRLESGLEREELASSHDFSGIDAFSWSEPVWLGPVVNSSARDWRPLLSSDGLKLFFHSNRSEGSMGGFDIWMSRRDGPNCPWQTPVNLGAPVNTSGNEGDAGFTPDGRTMFYSWNAPADKGSGRGDIFMSQLTDPNDDLSWGEPVNLGKDVNTTGHESNPVYVPAEGNGALYFSRAPDENPSPPYGDIYKVSMSRDGRTSGPAVPVAELNEPPPIGDHSPTVRADGRELIFWSGGAAGSRPGSVGLADLWVSTRQSVNDPWSAPRNLGAPVNTTSAELTATLSHDGTMLFFTSTRPDHIEAPDMWMSTRGPSAQRETTNSTDCDTP